ncbi:PEP-CTERM sorting domain-containing protein [Phycisphaeraceae bacterium D3-23]
MMPRQAPRYRLPALLLAASACAAPGHAAYISEVFQSGPAGQGIELSGIDPAQGATLAILDGSRFSTSGFGRVLELIHLPADPGGPPVVLITDMAWPDASVQPIPLADVPHASSQTTLALGGSLLDRLLVVFDGETDLLLDDNPVNTSDAQMRYDASTVTDWLAIGPGDLSSGYGSSPHNIAGINSALGIDLLARTADRQAGQVIARANTPGQALDLDVLYVGDPDVTGHFDAGGSLVYRTTPGHANLPLLHPAPEPGSAAVLLTGAVLLMRRRRAWRCSFAARGL